MSVWQRISCNIHLALQSHSKIESINVREKIQQSSKIKSHRSTIQSNTENVTDQRLTSELRTRCTNAINTRCYASLTWQTCYNNTKNSLFFELTTVLTRLFVHFLPEVELHETATHLFVNVSYSSPTPHGTFGAHLLQQPSRTSISFCITTCQLN